MTTKQQYEAVVTSTDMLLSDINGLENTLDETDLTFDTNLATIRASLIAIGVAADDKLDEIEQEKVMSDFLSEMKVVFNKYNAKIEIGSDATGYGESYGSGETAVGIKLTATFEGVTSTKEINKSVIVESDLV